MVSCTAALNGMKKCRRPWSAECSMWEAVGALIRSGDVTPKRTVLWGLVINGPPVGTHKFRCREEARLGLKMCQHRGRNIFTNFSVSLSFSLCICILPPHTIQGSGTWRIYRATIVHQVTPCSLESLGCGQRGVVRLDL